jgi:hypothetical protein
MNTNAKYETFDDLVTTPDPNKNHGVASILKNRNEGFINTRWRPMMAWIYMLVIIFDFIIFPIMWSSLQAYQGILVTLAWDPITLKSGGFFHVAMGAVLGITAYGRTQEKLNNRDGSL